MNWKNTAENLFLVLVGIIVGVAIGYYVSVKTAESMLEKQKSLIEAAIAKETTSVNNTVTNDFNKVKNRKGQPINIIIEPYQKGAIQQNKAEQSNNSLQDSIAEPEKKRGFFGRLFGRKNKD